MDIPPNYVKLLTGRGNVLFITNSKALAEEKALSTDTVLSPLDIAMISTVTEEGEEVPEELEKNLVEIKRGFPNCPEIKAIRRSEIET